MDRIAAARDGLDRAAQRFERAQARLEAVSATDGSGQVSVRLAPSGEILDVLLDPHWTSRLDPEEFAGAVLEAYAGATTLAANEWGHAVADQMDEPEPQTRPLPPTEDSVSARLAEIVSPETLAQRSEASLQAMADMLRTVKDDLDTVSAEAEALAQRVVTGRSKGVTVTMIGSGVLTGVDVDPEWARVTSPANLAARLMGAYTDARRQQQSRTVDDLIAGSSIGELQRLAHDPRALAERLRLT
jgi:DNA-binding protein YbaB